MVNKISNVLIEKNLEKEVQSNGNYRNSLKGAIYSKRWIAPFFYILIPQPKSFLYIFLHHKHQYIYQ